MRPPFYETPFLLRTAVRRQVVGFDVLASLAGPSDASGVGNRREDERRAAADLGAGFRAAIGRGDQASSTGVNGHLRYVLTADGGVRSEACGNVAGRETSRILEELSHSRLGAVSEDRTFRDLRTDGVILVGRDSDGREDGDDRDDDHQFDKGKAFLHSLHGVSYLLVVS